MPIYEYEPDSGRCDTCGGRFEFYQQMSDQPLKICPVCNQPCHQVISAPSPPQQNPLSTSNLADKGFTKYVRTSDGTYEKQGGPGPDLPDPTKKRKRK